MMKRIACVGIVLVGAVVSTASASAGSRLQRQTPTLQDHVAWVADSLTRMKSIKAGMTRADLLKLFEADGGLQTDRVFVFRDCPYFKVSVEWEPTGRVPTGRTMAELQAFIDGQPGDVIKTISRPYIEGMKID